MIYFWLTCRASLQSNCALPAVTTVSWCHYCLWEDPAVTAGIHSRVGSLYMLQYFWHFVNCRLDRLKPLCLNKKLQMGGASETVPLPAGLLVQDVFLVWLMFHGAVTVHTEYAADSNCKKVCASEPMFSWNPTELECDINLCSFHEPWGIFFLVFS